VQVTCERCGKPLAFYDPKRIGICLKCAEDMNIDSAAEERGRKWLERTVG